MQNESTIDRPKTGRELLLRANAWRGAWRILIAFVLLTMAARAYSADSLTEYQVKSLCILNFTKYIDWPADAAPVTNAPIVIGCLSGGKMMESLKEASEGKTISGRKIEVIEANTPGGWASCSVLFINSSEKKHLPEILAAIRDHPVLTVGESDQFLQQGGTINFVKKDGKVRFEINIDAARASHIQVSSKLLTLADSVVGKP